MPDVAEPLVAPEIAPQDQTKESVDPGYLVVCWNDPVNLMDYVTHVFRKIFGWNLQKAEFHMLQVHNEGKSVLTREALEKAQFYVAHLQAYSLHASLEKENP